MKKFEDSDFFGDGSDIIATSSFNYHKEFAELSNAMYEFEEQHKPGIRREPKICQARRQRIFYKRLQ